MSLQFVPKSSSATLSELASLTEFVLSSRKLLLLTGAGVSTESGIPDYRSEEVGLYARSDRRPMQHSVFMRSSSARRSYWARNYVGWSRWSDFKPNQAHRAIAQLERLGQLQQVITQNVDQLHYKAGNSRVIELHGTNSIVECQSCGHTIPRHTLQSVLSDHNPDFPIEYFGQQTRPDGDVDIDPELVSRFNVPSCPRCGSGPLKPQVVFFGDNVPMGRVEKCHRQLEASDAMLVIGSSLFVYSGYRFVLRAKELGLPLAIMNIGKTRADNLADVRIHARAGDALTHVLRAIQKDPS